MQPVLKLRLLSLCAALMLVLAAPAARAEETVSVNFEGVDIRLVIKLMSELTGENFIVDESVKGQVTVLSPKKLPVSEALEVLESALAVNNYALISSGKTHKVVPREDARIGLVSAVGAPAPTAPGGETVVTRVFMLRRADADKVRELIAPHLGKTGRAGAFASNNSLVVCESAATLNEIAKIIDSLDSAGGGGATLQNRVFKLTRTTPTALSSVLGKVFGAKTPDTGTAAAQGSACTFVPSDATGDLVVSAPASLMPEIESAIRRMDALSAQVLVEALIVEISDNKTLEWGLELAAAGGAVFGTGSGFAGAQTSGAAKSILTGGTSGTTAAGYVDRTRTVGGNLVIPDRAALVKAAKGKDDVNILSSPRILASNNEEAEILVGRTVPFIRNSQVTAEGGTVRTFEFKDVGLMLKILPNILDPENVRLKVHQEVEEVIGSAFEGAVETSKRMVSSTVQARNGQTIVLGGLKTDSKTSTVVKVPLLGDLPLLGKLFRSEKKAKNKMNLFLFITPYVLETPADADELTRRAQSSAGTAPQETPASKNP